MTERETDGHPEEGRLLAHLDGELPDGAAARLEEHLAGCEACRERREELAAASDLLRRELRAREVEVPPGDPLGIRRLARERAAADGGGGRQVGGRGKAPSGGDGRRDGGTFGSATLWRAAVLVLGVGAAASATVPGSPVEGWLSDAVRALAGSFPDDGSASSAGAAATASGAASQGVSLQVSGRAVVRLVDPAPGLRIHVRPTGDSLLTVVARGGRYRAAEGVVEVVGAEPPDLRIELPGSAAPARVSAGEVLLLERVDGRVRVHVPGADTADDGTISFSVDGSDG